MSYAGPDAYQAFLEAKTAVEPPTGLTGDFAMPADAFEFQRDITRWGLRRGRAALFAGTGLGKTLMQLAWSQAVVEATNRPVLIFTPPLVAAQFVEQGARFGVEISRAFDQSDIRAPGIYATNYERMHLFDFASLGGVDLDESSILKSTDGATRTALVKACQSIAFRLAATATPAPNDLMELGNHAEFLGVMSYTDMLATFFTHDGGDTQKWRLKGHAEDAFWRWLCSWAVMLTKPSDLGYSDDGYILPPLRKHQHTVEVPIEDCFAAGSLIPIPAQGLAGRLTARRESIGPRVDLAASLATPDQPWVFWCNLNAEQDALEAALGAKAFSIRGADHEKAKEERHAAWKAGERPYLITKGSIFGWGMNWQHCRRTALVGLNDSFEQVYQIVRRFWRFGQTDAVDAHFIAAASEGPVVANLARKEAEAERMIAGMVRHMADLTSAEVRGLTRNTATYAPAAPVRLPDWLKDRAA